MWIENFIFTTNLLILQLKGGTGTLKNQKKKNQYFQYTFSKHKITKIIYSNWNFTLFFKWGETTK